MLENWTTLFDGVVVGGIVVVTLLLNRVEALVVDEELLPLDNKSVSW